jgi:hypothetical protein
MEKYLTRALMRVARIGSRAANTSARAAAVGSVEVGVLGRLP